MSGPIIQGADCVEATRATVDGFELFVLQNQHIELAVAPELGAKVLSLRNRQTGRDWMYFPTRRRELFRNDLGDDFARSPVAGWDECLPTIAPCEWNKCLLPDHGEAWALPWRIDQRAWRDGHIKTRINLPLSRLLFERTISLVANKVVVDYAITNQADGRKDFLWAMHPLLALQAGDQLELPREAMNNLRNAPWLRSLQFEKAAQACAKTFIGPLSQGLVALQNSRSRDRLSFSWDASRCNSLGVWLTRGGWHGLHHLALEPTNGVHDSLAVSARRKCCGQLNAKEQQSWRVEIKVEAVAAGAPQPRLVGGRRIKSAMAELESKL